MTEEKYRSADISIKVIGMLITFILATIAWSQSQEQKEKEFFSTFYNNRILVVNEVIDLVEKISVAENDEKRSLLIERLWAIHYGYSHIYFTADMNEALSEITGYVSKCYMKTEIGLNTDFDCERSLITFVTKFANAARKEFALGWESQFTDVASNGPFIERE